MIYVVTEACIKCKYMDCIEVCPVDCFYEGENMVSSIPTNASTAASANRSARPGHRARHGKGHKKWLELNRTLSTSWPNITRKGKAPADADDFKGMTKKYSRYFSDKAAPRA